jgi:hypothetical protein
MDKNLKIALIAVAVVVAVVIVWGLIGSSQASNIGTTCDWGLGENGDVFCWKWHRNAIGQVSDAVSDLLGKK